MDAQPLLPNSQFPVMLSLVQFTFRVFLYTSVFDYLQLHVAHLKSSVTELSNPAIHGTTRS